MLIRSQDKRILINMNNVSSIEVGDNELRIFADDGETIYDLGSYSTRAKAMKLLDMVQDAYERYEYEKVFKTGLTLFETFQMPEDGSAEV